jgi:transposase InsO family protein
VTGIDYNNEHGCIIAYREALDGQKAEEGDDEPFIVDSESKDCVRALVELYEETHEITKEDNINEIVDEQTMLELQLLDPEISILAKEFNKQYDEKGNIKQIQSSILSGNNKQQIFEWDVNGTAPAIRRVYTVNIKQGNIVMSKEIQAILVPRKLVAILLRKYHDRFGHPSHSRMYATMREKYYWKGMANEIAPYAESCHHCQQRKKVYSRKVPLLTYSKNIEPFERCHIDLCGPFVTTKRKMKYILVFKDALTKWIELFAIPDKSENTVAECMFDEIIMRHGAPQVLISDQGKEFINKVVRQLTLLLRIRRVTTSPYNPRADGMAEKAVASVKDMISAYVNVFQDNWDDYLAIVAHYYRNTVNIATGFTPYYLLYKRECRQPDELWIRKFNDDIDKGELKDRKGNEILIEDYVRGASEALQIIWELVGSQLEEDAIKVANTRNKLIQKTKEFHEGDKVMIEKPPKTTYISAEDSEIHKTTRSLGNKYEGPYQIVRKISPITYIVNVKGKEQHHGIERMKRYYTR